MEAESVVSYRGLVRLERAELDDLVIGKISLLYFAVHNFLKLKVNPMVGSRYPCPPGIWIGSARAIRALAPAQALSERAIQRSLVRLEKFGWIKRWVTRGRTGNYPIMVAQHPVGDLSGRQYTVNAAATQDWRNPTLDPVGGAGAHPSTYQEIRQDKGTEKRARSSRTAPASKDQTGTQSRRSHISEAACRLAHLLRDSVLLNNPRARITEQQVERWAEEADQMMRTDGRSEQEIAYLIDWSQHDDFWRSIILSMTKLREKFDQLTVKSTHARSYERRTSSAEGGEHETSKFSRIPRVQ